MRKTVVLEILLVLLLALSGCGSDSKTNDTAASAGTVTLSEDYADALPVSLQLTIGTLMLEGSENAVTTEQAQELLPVWQMYQSLESSGTAAQVEIDTVLKQLQEAMSTAQLAAIKEMKLTPDSMTELAQQQGFGRGLAGGGGQAGGFQPPAGFTPPEGGAGFGGGPGFGGGFGPASASSGDQAAQLTARTNRLAGTASINMVISLLKARAAGETWTATAPNRDFALQRTLLSVIAEATGQDQQAIFTQAQEGKTLSEIIAANGGDVDEIVAQVVAAETERVNQAVADGTMEQTEADQWLADLEARAEGLLDEPHQATLLDSHRSVSPKCLYAEQENDYTEARREKS
jgi:hypothetical protein